MTVVVNLRNSEEEKVLMAFLNSLEYDYQTTADNVVLTEEQQKEILRREKAFAEGKTSARTWDEIKKELENVYR
jgi:putative addiction module component (TIGR02574 family)